jgi:hypothetical protein
LNILNDLVDLSRGPKTASVSSDGRAGQKP